MLTYYSVWTVDDDKCKGTWGDLKFVLNRCAMLSLAHTFAILRRDNGCADTLGRREWSSKLFDIVGSWEV